jgi:hypothetical protein
MAIHILKNKNYIYICLVNVEGDSNIFNAPQIIFLITNTIFFWKGLPFSPPILNTSPHFWAMGQIAMWERNILGAHSWVHVVPPRYLSIIFILNFVHHIFALGFYKVLVPIVICIN